MNTFTLADTRPYPQNPIKNHLLLNAYQLAHNSSQASRKLSSEQLQTEIRGMLQQNHYINLSLALTMTPDAGTYTALLSSVIRYSIVKKTEKYSGLPCRSCWCPAVRKSVLSI